MRTRAKALIRPSLKDVVRPLPSELADREHKNRHFSGTKEEREMTGEPERGRCGCCEARFRRGVNIHFEDDRAPEWARDEAEKRLSDDIRRTICDTCWYVRVEPLAWELVRKKWAAESRSSGHVPEEHGEKRS